MSVFLSVQRVTGRGGLLLVPDWGLPSPKRGPGTRLRWPFPRKDLQPEAGDGTWDQSLGWLELGYPHPPPAETGKLTEKAK